MDSKWKWEHVNVHGCGVRIRRECGDQEGGKGDRTKNTGLQLYANRSFFRSLSLFFA